MKKILILAAIMTAAIVSNAQLNPVNWSFTSKKIAEKTYEVRMTATLQSGWHLYSQMQPEDAVAIPTKVSFNKNPLLTLDGAVKEEGKMEKFHDAKLEVSANQYDTKVEFVQTVKLKASAKTNVSGSVKFQTCNDKMCLPAKTVTFSIAL